MKYILIALMIFGISCKKDNPTTPAPVPVASNYIIVNGDSYVNDTIQLSYSGDANYYAFDSSLWVTASGPLASVGMRFHFDGVGNYHYVEAYPYTNYIPINGVHYESADLNIHVTNYGNVGQKILMDFTGSYRKSQDTTILINVSCKLSITRNQ